MRPALTMQAIVARGSNHAAAEIGDEVMILSLRSGAYYGLRDVAARIWELLDDPRSVAQLSAAIAAEYDVDPDRCARDTMAFLESLISRGLVQVRRDAAAGAR